MDLPQKNQQLLQENPVRRKIIHACQASASCLEAATDWQATDAWQTDDAWQACKKTSDATAEETNGEPAARWEKAGVVPQK